MLARHRTRPMIEGLTAVIDSRFPLAEAAAAHRHIEARAAVGRVVLVP